MKTTIKQLESLLSKINDNIEQREIIFMDKSERWQESESGQEFSEKTDQLQSAHDMLQEAIEELIEFNEP